MSTVPVPATVSSSPSQATKVPRLYPEGTVVCLGAGPSVQPDDLARLEASGLPVVAVNTMYHVAPFSTVLYAADLKWWEWERWAPTFTGLRVTSDFRVRGRHGGVTVAITGNTGIETDPGGVRNGGVTGVGGYQAINVAVHLGATRILLVGYDHCPGPGGEHHCHPEHPDRRHLNYAAAVPMFRTMVAPLQILGIDVLNCSRMTDLDAFPRMPLVDALCL